MYHMVKKEYMREPLRLASMLLTANIPFEIGEMCNGFIICYPCMGDGCVSDAICHDGSYGRNEGLLEIMGLVDKEKTGGDSVEGWLTAEEVFERWHKHWLETHAEEEGAISALFSLVAPLTFAAARFLIFFSPLVHFLFTNSLQFIYCIFL